MRVSDDEIWAKRTDAAKVAGVGAWSAKQLRKWGVSWPPPKGWRHRLNGGVYCEASRQGEPERDANGEIILVTRARARLDALELAEAEALAERIARDPEPELPW